MQHSRMTMTLTTNRTSGVSTFQQIILVVVFLLCTVSCAPTCSSRTGACNGFVPYQQYLIFDIHLTHCCSENNNLKINKPFYTTHIHIIITLKNTHTSTKTLELNSNHTMINISSNNIASNLFCASFSLSSKLWFVPYYPYMSLLH